MGVNSRPGIYRCLKPLLGVHGVHSDPQNKLIDLLCLDMLLMPLRIPVIESHEI